MKPIMKPISISMSALQTFIRCEKKGELQYIKGIVDDKPDGEALEKGTRIHKYFEMYLTGNANEMDWTTEEGVLVSTYLKHNPIKEKPTHVEQTLSVRVYEDVELTFTPDVITRNYEKQIVDVWDWKSFSKMPSLDTDLDFQTNTYLAAVAQLFPEVGKFRFVHKQLRTTAPLVPKDKAGGVWQPQECYFDQVTVLSRAELEEVWADTVDRIDEIVTKVRSQFPNYRRTYLRGFDFNSCGHCPVKGLCNQDYEKQPSFTNFKPNTRGTIFDPQRED
jgi:hypothetical protein